MYSFPSSCCSKVIQRLRSQTLIIRSTSMYRLTLSRQYSIGQQSHKIDQHRSTITQYRTTSDSNHTVSGPPLASDTGAGRHLHAVTRGSFTTTCAHNTAQQQREQTRGLHVLGALLCIFWSVALSRTCVVRICVRGIAPAHAT